MRSSNTTTCVSVGPRHATTLLTDLLQQCKDVEDKLKDLIPWLTKLKDSVMATSADGNHEETKRLEQLTQCVLHPRRPLNPT